MSRLWAAIFFGLCLAALPAAAEPQCGDRHDVLKLLSKKYKESPIAAGITNSGGLVEVLSNATGNTWTIIVTTPQGRSCVVATGEGWREIQKYRKGTGI